jgi:hypothetical protein
MHPNTCYSKIADNVIQVVAGACGASTSIQDLTLNTCNILPTGNAQSIELLVKPAFRTQLTLVAIPQLTNRGNLEQFGVAIHR